MHTTILRKVGGSVMITLPPAFLEALQIKAGSTVGMTIEDGQLVVKPQNRRRHTLSELLAECNPHAPLTEEDKEWLEAPAVGNELL